MESTIVCHRWENIDCSPADRDQGLGTTADAAGGAARMIQSKSSP